MTRRCSQRPCSSPSCAAIWRISTSRWESLRKLQGCAASRYQAITWVPVRVRWPSIERSAMSGRVLGQPRLARQVAATPPAGASLRRARRSGASSAAGGPRRLRRVASSRRGTGPLPPAARRRPARSSAPAGGPRPRDWSRTGGRGRRPRRPRPGRRPARSARAGPDLPPAAAVRSRGPVTSCQNSATTWPSGARNRCAGPGIG